MKSSRGLIAEGAVLAFAGLAVVAAARQAAATTTKKSVDPEADQVLRQMTDYLASLRSFTVRTAVADEVALKSGEKIQLMSNADISVQRPNRLRSTQRGSAGLGIWYDGQNMTVACKSTGSYQTLPGPPTLDAAIDQMRDKLDIDAPGADLLFSRPHDILTEQVTSGRLIGRETIDGVPVNHLAFRGDQIDWQLWIKDGPQPLPLRYVITTKDVAGHPQFAVEMSDWSTQPNLPASTFQFQPPAGAKPAAAVVSTCGSAL